MERHSEILHCTMESDGHRQIQEGPFRPQVNAAAHGEDVHAELQYLYRMLAEALPPLQQLCSEAPQVRTCAHPLSCKSFCLSWYKLMWAPKPTPRQAERSFYESHCNHFGVRWGVLPFSPPRGQILAVSLAVA